MKNRFKMLILGLCVTSFANAASAFGTYQKSTGYSEFAKDRKDDNAHLAKTWSETSNPEYKFSVDGVEFILLDTDEDGNYFVMTEKTVAARGFDTTYLSTVPLAEYENNTETVFDDAIESFKKNEWKFDPNDETNIAYWLNNDFLEKTTIPESVKENMKDTLWGVEGMESLTNLYTATLYPVSRTVEDLTDSFNIEPYEVTCKIALPSYKEIKQYIDILGYQHTSWKGMMMRTPAAGLFMKETDSVQKLCVKYGLFMKASDSGKWIVAMADTMGSDYGNNAHYLRPCFFLDKDFFKNAKCDIGTLGKYPLLEVRKHGYDNLSGIYSSDEIESLKLYADAIFYETVTPAVKHIRILSDASVGKTIRAEYAFVKGTDEIHDGLEEGYSSYQWYYSDIPKGEKKQIAGATDTELLLSEDLEGKYIWFSVTPENYFGKQGENTFSKYVIKVKKANELTVAFKSADSEIFSLDGVNELTIEASSDDSDTVAIYVVKYNADNFITMIGIEELGLDKKCSYTVDIQSGERVKVIALKDGVVPYSINEIR